MSRLGLAPTLGGDTTSRGGAEGAGLNHGTRADGSLPPARLEASRLVKRFGQTAALDAVSLSVAGGEILGLLGPNGAGKTTAMMILAGFLEADSGSVQVEGIPLQRRVRAHLGLVPQELALYPELSIRHNLEFFGSLYGLSGLGLRARVEEMLAAVGLETRADDPVHTCSGGMKRRLSFAAGVVHRPRVLLLDEPTVGVDARSRDDLLTMIREEARRGVAVVFASHHLEEAQAICHRVAVLDRGRLVACDTVKGLLGRLGGELRLRVDGLPPGLEERLREVARVDAETSEVILVARECGDLGGQLLVVLTALDALGVRLLHVDSERPSLGRLFLELTGEPNPPPA